MHGATIPLNAQLCAVARDLHAIGNLWPTSPWWARPSLGNLCAAITALFSGLPLRNSAVKIVQKFTSAHSAFGADLAFEASHRFKTAIWLKPGVTMPHCYSARTDKDTPPRRVHSNHAWPSLSLNVVALSRAVFVLSYAQPR
jgi:hypothetical protein